MANDENDGGEDYRAGYGQPPRDTRFKKGQSGSPKGRPRGCKNLATLLEREFDTPVVIREQGQSKRITKREAAIKQLTNRMVSGDPRAIPYLFKLMEQQAVTATVAPSTAAAGDEVIDPEDARKLQEKWKAFQAKQRAAEVEEEEKKKEGES